jgi:ATP-binding cassette subfamily B protein
MKRIRQLNQEASMVRRIVWRTLKEQWQVSRPLLVINLIFVPLTALLPLLASWLAGDAINKLVAALQGGVDSRQVYTAFAVAAVAGLLSSLLGPIQRYFRDNAEVQLELFLERRMNQHMLTVDLPTMESPAFVEIFNKAAYRHVWAHRRVTDQVFRLSSSVIQLVGAAAILIHLELWLLPVLLLAILPSTAVSFYVGRLRDRVVWNDPENLRAAERRTTRYIYGENTNVEIRLNTAQRFFLDTGERFRRLFAERELGVNRTYFRLSTAAQLFEQFVLLLIQLSLVARVLTDRSFGVGTYTFYFQTVQTFSGASSMLISGISSMYEDCLILRDYYSVLDTEPTIISKPGAPRLKLTAPPLIEFKNVSFTYPGAPKPVLANLNLTIQPGEKIALVGENGAGKTTIVKLLTRLYEVSDGQILINGRDIRDIDLNSWHQHVGAVMQHYGKYIYDVRRNVGVGRIEQMSNKRRLQTALEQADASQFVSEFKHGVNQPLATMFKDGITPSGGQWQRMALARAMFRQAQVLILDEPTASVDARAEYTIFKQLMEQQRDKTTIIISHRFSTVRQADTIYVLENGTIIEQGSHQQLLKADGVYKNLFELQAAGYR